MEAKNLVKSRTKLRGRPTVTQKLKLRDDILDAFKEGLSAYYTAHKLDINVNTVYAYFKEFSEIYLEQANDEFVQRQRRAKEVCLAGLDKDLADIEIEIEELATIISKEKDIDEVACRKMKHDLIWKRSQLRQQKNAIDTTPTIDVSLEQMVKDRYAEEEEHDTATSNSNIRQT